MKIFNQYSNPGSKHLIQEVFRWIILLFLSVIFVNNQSFSNDKNHNLKLRFYDLQGMSLKIWIGIHLIRKVTILFYFQ